MTALSPTSPKSPAFENFQGTRPAFCIGQHDSARWTTLTDGFHNYILRSGFNFVTTPITNRHFRQRVVDLYEQHLKDSGDPDLTEAEKANPSLPGPIVPTLTDEDTTLFPSNYVSTMVAFTSPWIDLSSEDPLVANLSRQVLNLEVAYANFCGVRSIVIPGPRDDGKGNLVVQYARAVQEAFEVATRVNFTIQLPMYREPGLEDKEPVLGSRGDQASDKSKEIEIFSSWDSWHTIRTVCNYHSRLFVGLRVPRRLPEMELQTRWFAEAVHYISFDPSAFQENRAGYPSLTKLHQDMINMYMRLKIPPWMMLQDAGPEPEELSNMSSSFSDDSMAAEFPSLAQAHSPPYLDKAKPPTNPYISYLRYVERQQAPLTELESSTLTSFQDWLQSPLQPLSDNLESATYEMFEGDPVKYDLYEKAITEAMAEWKALKKPTSALPRGGNNRSNNDSSTKPAAPELVVAVAGAGRGPLVTRVLRASDKTGVPIQLWALEKNQNAYVYLLRQNKREWGGRVHVIKTDMRDWGGPVPEGYGDGDDGGSPITTTVDILVTELLGSFGDNELSPECLDGIQKHLARPHGLSIPHSYTAHLSPISYPRIHADLRARAAAADLHAFDTPWVVRLFAIDFVSQRVPGRDRFQQAWEFVHPVRLPFAEAWEADRGPWARVQRPGAGAMHLSAGLNDHNARHCHLTFVCRPRGVVHGLAGYFESVLYRSQVEGRSHETVELSTLPEQIDKKSKDMVSWFPIFFPLKKPLYFPQDSELEVSMWRQTDDTKVWYEWMVEAYAWAGPNTRVKVGASELHTSREVACRM